MAWLGWAGALVWLDVHERLNYQVSLLTLDGGVVGVGEIKTKAKASLG